MTKTNAEIRAEGERHVVAELRRRNILHRLEPRGRRVDIVVPALPHSLTLQVRVTSLGQRQGWLLSKEMEDDSDERLLYAFVNTEPSVPETFLVPAAVVSEAVRESHAAWLAMPGRNGQRHRDIPMRMILMDYRFPVRGFPSGWLEKYRGRWDLLRISNR